MKVYHRDGYSFNDFMVREDIHKKFFFFSGRTTKVLPPSVVRGVYPPYTLSDPTTKKNIFCYVCLPSQKFTKKIILFTFGNMTFWKLVQLAK